jgi:hypothetical protein
MCKSDILSAKVLIGNALIGSRRLIRFDGGVSVSNGTVKRDANIVIRTGVTDTVVIRSLTIVIIAS